MNRLMFVIGLVAVIGCAAPRSVVVTATPARVTPTRLTPTYQQSTQTDLIAVSEDRERHNRRQRPGSEESGGVGEPGRTEHQRVGDATEEDANERLAQRWAKRQGQP